MWRVREMTSMEYVANSSVVIIRATLSYGRKCIAYCTQEHDRGFLRIGFVLPKKLESGCKARAIVVEANPSLLCNVDLGCCLFVLVSCRLKV